MKIKKTLIMEASDHEWEARAVLNPTVVKDKEGIEHIFYRAVAKNWISSIGYAKMIDGKIQRFDKPIIFPTKSYEKKGVEDPRITKIGKIYYMLYTAFDGKDAKIAYATSTDLKKWTKKGVISPSVSVKKARSIVKIKKYRDSWKHQEIYGRKIALWDKDAVLFPEKIKGKFVMLHRLLPDIQIIKFKKFSELKREKFWEDYIENLSEGEDKISLYRRYNWEDMHIGAGATPIKTKKGWLLIYHGVSLKKGTTSMSRINKILYKIQGLSHQLRNKRLPMVYHAGAALLDLKNPEAEIARLKEPLFSPELEWEKQGDISDVVFPEGVTVDGDNLRIFYGCSDSRIGLAEMSLKQLLSKFK